jgi:endonuclease G
MKMKRRLFCIAVLVIGVALAGCNAPPGTLCSCIGDKLFAGLPRSTSEYSQFKELSNIGYIVGYSESRKDPLWAAYRLMAMDNPPAPGPRPDKFKTDDRTEAKVKHDDYTNSGYDRGHMAPNWAIATRYGQAAQLETFFMSNICPQKPALNRGLWKCLEMIVAKAYANQFGDIWVIVGPVFDSDIETLPSGVEVPDSFYMIMVVLENEQIHIQAFLINQQQEGRESLNNFITNVDSVEDETGLDFFADLPDALEEHLESAVPTSLWKVDKRFISDIPDDCLAVLK